MEGWCSWQQYWIFESQVKGSWRGSFWKVNFFFVIDSKPEIPPAMAMLTYTLVTYLHERKYSDRHVTKVSTPESSAEINADKLKCNEIV
jgi:hypothetical protein